MSKITIKYKNAEVEWDVRGRADGNFTWGLTEETLRELASQLPHDVLAEMAKSKEASEEVDKPTIEPITKTYGYHLEIDGEDIKVASNEAANELVRKLNKILPVLVDAGLIESEDNNE
jgi:hypothetical protein